MSRQKQIHDKRRLQNAYKRKVSCSSGGGERQAFGCELGASKRQNDSKASGSECEKRGAGKGGERALNERRRKLKALLDEYEFYALQSELKNSFETMDQRRERLVREVRNFRKIERDKDFRLWNVFESSNGFKVSIKFVRIVPN